MTFREPARRPTHRRPGLLVAGVVVAIAAVAPALVSGSLASASPSVSATAGALAHVQGVVPGGTTAPRRTPRAAPDELDGVVPAGTTVFDDDVPGVAKLDAALLRALRHAATAAAADGVELVVDSGWRSPAYQERLLRDAIAKYGSRKEAAKWVATPTTSAHVSGDAVDIGPAAATAWLSDHGSRYGLCQIYRNEPWHYELRPGAGGDGCPRMYADPTHDPGMQG